MTNTIKCPQCGAARIEKVSRNKCSCPYCGNVFYVEADSEFVKQETDGLKLSQKIEREEFKRSLKQKKKNLFIFWEIGIILFVPLVALLSWVIVMIANYFSDKYIDFSCEYEKISFLQEAPFESKGKTCVFSDYARKVTINGKMYDVDNMIINGDYILLCCNRDSTVAYFEINGEKYQRPIRNSTYKILDFHDEDALRHYLCERPFQSMDDTLRFIKDAYSVIYNGIEISNYIEYDFHYGQSPNLWRYYSGWPIEARAVIGIHHYRGLDILYLMMAEDGKDAYLLPYGSNKKIIRQ